MLQSRKRLLAEAAAAVLWCLLTLATDRLFFRYDWHTPAFFVYKGLFVLLAFAVVHGAVTLVRNIRRKDPFTLRWLQWMTPYLILTLIVLVIVWPGCWGSDDLDVLQRARILETSSWQHFLTSAAFILCLMFLPLPGGIVLIQTLLIAGVVGCFLAAAETLARERLAQPPARGWFALLYIPFLLPPVLLHDMQPFRSTWSTWTELFTVFLLVWWYLRRQRITAGQMALLTGLGVLTASWRGESVYYVVALPVLMAFLVGRKLLHPAVAVINAAAILVLTLGCSKYNNVLMGQQDWTYQSVALCYQTAALVQDADPVEDAELLEKIDPVFDVQACRNFSNLHGPELRKAVTRSFYDVTEAQWDDCKKAIISLAIKYPGSLLRERMGVFLNTVKQTTQSNQKLVFASTVLVYTTADEEMPERQKDFLYNSIGTRPLDQQFRQNFIMALSYQDQGLGVLVDATWWMLPPFALLLAAIVVLLVQRKWMLFFAVGALFARIPLVFLTAPDTYFMYYLTPYIAGYAVTAAAVVYAVLRHKKKREGRMLP